MSGTIDISISIVVLNHRNDLVRLLPSLVAALTGMRAEILVVDNRSGDGSVDLILAQFPYANIVRNTKRSGYGENHNINIRRATGRYIVVMNTDMVLDAGVFRELLAFVDETPEVGIVCPKVLNEDGTIQGLNKRYPTVLDLGLRRFSPRFLKSIFKRRMDRYEMKDVGYDRSYDVPFVSGAFMFCRREVLVEVGCFDEDYFLYFEDADLCRRVQRKHRTVYCPAAVVVHFWRREAHLRVRHLFYFIRSAGRYFWRWGLVLW